MFHAAERSYNRLIKSPKKIKYRDNWLKCIKKFESVYATHPNDPWAAAALYKTGELYKSLYRRSYRGSDKQAAADAFQLLINTYPKSRYRQLAQSELRQLNLKKKKATVYKKPNSTQEQFAAAQSCYERLLRSPNSQKYRDRWLSCISKFKSAYIREPQGPLAPGSLYMTGELYNGLYKKSFRGSDRANAQKAYQQIISDYPNSSYRRKAESALGEFVTETTQSGKRSNQTIAKNELKSETTRDEISKVIETYSQTGSSDKSITFDARNGRPSTVSRLRFWSNPNYTRIVVDADKETPFTYRLLKKDPTINKPQRLYIDLEQSRLGEGIQKLVPINDNLLLDARAGQYLPDKVRVVIDIKSFKTYKIFPLKNPYRIVVDVWGKDTDSTLAASPKQKKSGNNTASSGDIAKQLALGVRRIVIDPGHGGKDYGAPGYYKGVHEKYVSLKIANVLAAKIRKELNCEVILTRKGDQYLTLEERTAIANTQNADLFISIHTNAASDQRAYGIETYFLNLATDDEAIRVAARENATSTKNISDLQSILNDLMQNAKINESSRLAGYVHQSLLGHMRKKYSKIKSKGVKKAPFYVLLGAQMPAILIESSFISNPRECKRLTDPKYHDHLSQGIVNGIRQYIKALNPTALRKVPLQKSPLGS